MSKQQGTARAAVAPGKKLHPGPHGERQAPGGEAVGVGFGLLYRKSLVLLKVVPL